MKAAENLPVHSSLISQISSANLESQLWKLNALKYSYQQGSWKSRTGPVEVQHVEVCACSMKIRCRGHISLLFTAFDG